MPARNRIEILIEAKNNATAQLKRVGEGLDTLANIAMGGGVAFAGMQFARAVIDLSQLGAQAERTRQSFERLYGMDAEQMLGPLRRASRGAVADTDLLMAANRAQMLQVASSTDELTRLMEVARVRGQAMGLSTTQAFNDLVTGIGRTSSVILDNLGIITGGVRTYQEYAQSIGKTADALTDLEKKQALLQKVFRETEPMLEGAGVAASDAVEQFESLSAQWQNLREELGKEIQATVVVEVITRGVGGMAEGLRVERAVRKLMEPYEHIFGERVRADLAMTEQQYLSLRRAMDEVHIGLQNQYIAEEQAIAQLNALLGLEGNYVARMHEVDAARRNVIAGLNEMRAAGQLSEGQYHAQREAIDRWDRALKAGNITQDQFLERIASAQGLVAAFKQGLAELASVAGNDVYKGFMQAASGVDQLTLAFRNQAAAVQKAYDLAQFQADQRELQHKRDAAIQEYLDDLARKHTEANKRRLEGIARAQRDYNYAVADAAGQLAILNAELAKLTPGTEEHYDKLREIALLQQGIGKAAAKDYNQQLAELRSLVEGVLQPTEVTWEDVLATKAGVYVEKWDEAARRAADIANRGLKSPWAALFTIPPEVLARGEEHVKAWAAGMAEDIRIGLHPELIDWEAFDRALVEAAERKRAREAMVAEGIRRAAALGLGLTAAEIGATLGVPETATTTVAALETGLKQSALGAVVAETFEVQIKAQRTRFIDYGSFIAAAMLEGVQEGLTPSVADDLGRWLAPHVAAALEQRVY